MQTIVYVGTATVGRVTISRKISYCIGGKVCQWLFQPHYAVSTRVSIR